MNQIENVITQIENVNPSFQVKNHYHDLNLMKQKIHKVQIILRSVAYSVMIVLFILIAILKKNDNTHRKSERAILRDNGLTTIEIKKLVATELMIYMLKSAIIALILILVLSFTINRISHIYLATIGFYTFLEILVFSLISIILMYLVTIKKITQLETDKT